MFLPGSVYNRIPQIWILMGLMFIACGLYLGFEYKMIFVYLGMGAVSLVRGIWIFDQRAQVEKQRHLDNLRELRVARDAEAAKKKAEAENSDTETAEGQPTAKSEMAGDQNAAEQEPQPVPEPGPVGAASEPAANDSVVVVAEPRAREPGEPVQYDPYDSLATRQHK